MTLRTLDLKTAGIPAVVNRDELRRDLDRMEYEDSLYLFLRAAWKHIDPSPWVDGWPIEAVAEHLQAVADGDIRRLIINIPPRMGKSSITSVAFPAWVWAQEERTATSGPGVQFLHASYAEKLSMRDSVKCRRLIESAWYRRFWGDRFRLNADQNTKHRFSNDKGGERLITSISGTATGEGGSIIIIDDPNAANEAFSEATVAYTIDWWDQTIATRLNDPKTGAFVIIQQRLAEDDLTGHILEQDRGEWTHLCYDRETEILTKRGWVHFPELKDHEWVLGVNPETLEAQWELPSAVIREPYQGEMIAYHSETADLMVTPDHRMIYGDQNDIYVSDYQKWRVRPASALPGVFYLPQTVRWGSAATRDQIWFGEQLWEPMAFAEFMGWYLSEGCANAKRRTTRIVQKTDGTHVGDIDRVMASIPFHVGKRRHREGMLVWEIMSRPLATALALLGKSLEKHAPPELKELAPAYLQAFLLAYARGDGHFAVGNPRKITIGTGSAQMADDLQECAVKAGWAASLTIKHQRGGDVFNGYTRPPSTIYQVYIRASKAPGREHKIGSRIAPHHTTRQPYDGMVYCVSVPSSAVVVRRKGRVSVSGNCLPMHYEPDRAFETRIGWNDPRAEPGELLWPARFGEDEVGALERQLGPFASAGQLEQRPEPKGGGVIKRDWWQGWADKAFPPMDYILASLDTAYTEKTENDYSALTVWGVFTSDPVARPNRILDADGRPIDGGRHFMDPAPKVMLMTAWQERLALHELVMKAGTTCQKLKVDLLVIEDKAAGHSVAQEIRRLFSNESFGVQLLNPRSMDKLSRLYSVQHLFAEGMIHAPDRTWADMVITQVGVFPHGKNDDLVDTVSQGLRKLRDMGLLVRAPERLAEIEDAKRYARPPAPLYPA